MRMDKGQVKIGYLRTSSDFAIEFIVIFVFIILLTAILIYGCV